MTMKPHELTPRLIRELRRKHLVSFVAKVFETISAEDEFVPNWHLEAIAWELEQIEFGHSRRLLVTMPPRHLKSIMISVAWVAWMLGRYPTKRFVCLSYSIDLAGDHAKMCKEVMQSDWYRQLYPKTRLRGRAPDLNFRTTAGGGRLTTSTGGTITGRGGEIIIIDDPLKPFDAATSQVARENCISWYSNTLVTRLNRQATGSIIVVMQRIHEEDLGGHVLKEGGWHHLNLPAIAVEPDRIQVGPASFYQRRVGCALNPEHTSLEAFKLLRRRMRGDFDAQYQQQPIPAGGLLFKRAWMRYCDQVPQKRPGDLIVQCWDTATSERITSDYSACATALVRGSEVYLLHMYRARLSFPKLYEKTLELARHWKADMLLIEEAVSGRELLQELHHRKPTGIPRPLGSDATAHKVARAWGQTALVERGDLVLPKEAPWLGEFLHELLGFPRAKHDDQVDALVHLLGWVSSRQPIMNIPNAGPELVHEGDFSGDSDWDDFLDAWL
jgi:predicted phage terminase large subunit-like protein